MSIALMTLAWKTMLPSGRKIVLLALCDHANDHGECYPSIEALSRKCSMGQRTVQQHLSELEAVGIVVRRFRSGRSTVYQLDPRKFCITAAPAVVRNSDPISDVPAPLPPQYLTATPASHAPISINQPSRDPSPTNPQRARGMRLAPTWELPKAWGEWARLHRPAWTAEHVHLVAEKFRNYWVALPAQRGIRTDWFATWRNWCCNELPPNDDKNVGLARWWTSDATMLAKGAELGLTPLPGESTGAFKNRIQQELDHVGKRVTRAALPTTATRPERLAKATISSANRLAALRAARSLKGRHSDKNNAVH